MKKLLILIRLKKLLILIRPKKLLILISLLTIIPFVNAKNLEDKLAAVDVKFSQIKKLGKALKACSVDSDLVLAIIMKESSFIINAVNNSQDYGLMQINYYHVKAGGLDVEKLLNDVEYNVGVGCGILKWFISKYGFIEGIMRYNVGTSANAIRTKKAVNYFIDVYKFYKLFKVN